MLLGLIETWELFTFWWISEQSEYLSMFGNMELGTGRSRLVTEGFLCGFSPAPLSRRQPQNLPLG